jgi:hypothetical protein
MSNWPKTLDEAAEIFLNHIEKNRKEALGNLPEEELIELHALWGAYIREEYGLFDGNFELLKSCYSETMHPNHASLLILKTAWKKSKENMDAVSQQ